MSEPSQRVLVCVWDELSKQCQEDLMHARPGSIIRCTPDDFDLLRWQQLYDQAKQAEGLCRVGVVERRLTVLENAIEEVTYKLEHAGRPTDG